MAKPGISRATGTNSLTEAVIRHGETTKMATYKPSYAKNIIRRSLKAILDAPPTETELRALWDFFESACAYCGTPLNRSGRQGHADHLVAGGSNDVSNRVLACGPCNSDEKRDMPWEEFLALKESQPDVLSKRKERIMQWIARHSSKAQSVSPELEQRAHEIIEEAVKSFEEAVEAIRNIKKSL